MVKFFFTTVPGGGVWLARRVVSLSLLFFPYIYSNPLGGREGGLTITKFTLVILVGYPLLHFCLWEPLFQLLYWSKNSTHSGWAPAVHMLTVYAQQVLNFCQKKTVHSCVHQVNFPCRVATHLKSQPGGVVPSEQCCPGRSAHWLGVVVGQHHATRGHGLQVWRQHIVVVPWHVIITCPNTIGGMQIGSSVTTRTRCVHVFACLAPICMLTQPPRVRRTYGAIEERTVNATFSHQFWFFSTYLLTKFSERNLGVPKKFRNFVNK